MRDDNGLDQSDGSGWREVDNFTYILGNSKSPDGRDMGNVRTEESTMIPRCQHRLLEEQDLGEG